MKRECPFPLLIPAAVPGVMGGLLYREKGF